MASNVYWFHTKECKDKSHNLQETGKRKMVAQTYPEAIRRLLIHEGGYTNHPLDPGSATNFGITIFDYRKYINPAGTAEDVRRMTIDQARAIYRSKYWITAYYHCDELPAGVDYSIFDYGVNSGVGRAGKVLRRVCGLPDNASNSAVLDAVRKRKATDVVNAINDERLAFLKHLKTWPTFGKGWERRVAEVRTFSLKLAGSVQMPREPTNAPGKGEIPKPPTKTITGGAGTATVATGGGVWSWVMDHPVQSVLIAVIIAVAVALVIQALHKHRQTKQETPMPNTPVVPEIAL